MIIKGSDKRTITQIFGVKPNQGIYESPIKGIWDDVPWVEVGNVYVSLTITGNTSWESLVKKDKSDFIVVGGRHGNVINPISHNGRLDQNDLATKLDDAAHISLDNKIASSFGKRVTVVDVNKEHSLQTASNLKKLCKEAAANNKKVIFAWCYGLFTFCESTKVKVGEDPSNAKHPLFNDWGVIYKTPVDQIVAKYW